jgi:predicted RNA-binding protein with TRAM domain
MFGQGRRLAPVKEGDELDVKIEAIGEKGDGIAKKQGFVLFVPNSKEGDEVRVKVTRVLRNAGFAEVIGAGSVKPAAPQKPVEKKEEEEVAELEAESAEHDSEDFGEEKAEEEPVKEAEEVAEQPDDQFDASADNEPKDDSADDSEAAE